MKISSIYAPWLRLLFNGKLYRHEVKEIEPMSPEIETIIDTVISLMNDDLNNWEVTKSNGPATSITYNFKDELKFFIDFKNTKKASITFNHTIFQLKKYHSKFLWQTFVELEKEKVDLHVLNISKNLNEKAEKIKESIKKICPVCRGDDLVREAYCDRKLIEKEKELVEKEKENNLKKHKLLKEEEKNLKNSNKKLNKIKFKKEVELEILNEKLKSLTEDINKEKEKYHEMNEKMMVMISEVIKDSDKRKAIKHQMENMLKINSAEWLRGNYFVLSPNELRELKKLNELIQ